MKISIIIPAYNEEERIGKTLEEYSKFLRLKKQSKEIKDFEIITVLNGCRDNTLGVVDEKQKKFKEIRIINLESGGKGFAVITGFKDALKRENNLIGFVDADMATPPQSFFDLVKNINEYDGAIASRGLKESSVETSMSRRITNRGFNFLVKIFLFLPYKDTQCGAKIFKREALESVINDIGITKWAFDVDLLYKLKRKGFKVREIPTVWYDQAGSKVEVGRVSMQMLLAIIRLRILYSPFKGTIKIYDKLHKNGTKKA